MPMAETQRTLVAQPDCDANGHANIAFYVKTFSESGQNFLAKHGLQRLEYRPRNRHFKFLKELSENTCLRVSSTVIGRGSFAGFLFHILWDEDHDKISAVCLDAPFSEDLNGLPASRSGVPIYAMPRGITEPAFIPSDHEKLLSEKLAIRSYRGKIKPHHCSQSGLVDHHLLVEKFFKSAHHLWKFVGFDPAWFASNKLGAAAVEMKFTIHREISVGSDFEVISWMQSLRSKTARLSHQLISVPDGVPFASISALAIVMDLNSREAVEFPREQIGKFDRRFKDLEAVVNY